LSKYLKNHFPNSTAFVDLNGAVNNIKKVKERVSGRKILAVVKCNAYSHGAAEVSRNVEDYVDWFAVNNVDEGIHLRMNGIKKPILVFSVPTYQTAAAYVTHNLTATVSHKTHFSVLMDGTSYHLNFDTGMGRLGFYPEEAADVRSLAVASQRLICSGIYSHYATAGDPGSDYVFKQHEIFKNLLLHFSEVPLVHMSNTGAATIYPEIDQFDMIRTGLGMLGYNSGITRHDWLTPVLTWKTNIAQIRPIKQDVCVSYDCTWQSPEDGFLATLPVGYGDGIPRALSNKLKVLINGKFYQQVGNITMGMTMVYLENDKLPVQSEVTLLGGNGWNAHDWAEHAKTNVHEILTNISERVEVEYV
jgi:alanine racemase